LIILYFHWARTVYVLPFAARRCETRSQWVYYTVRHCTSRRGASAAGRDSILSVPFCEVTAYCLYWTVATTLWDCRISTLWDCRIASHACSSNSDKTLNSTTAFHLKAVRGNRLKNYSLIRKVACLLRQVRLCTMSLHLPWFLRIRHCHTWGDTVCLSSAHSDHTEKVTQLTIILCRQHGWSQMLGQRLTTLMLPGFTVLDMAESCNSWHWSPTFPYWLKLSTRVMVIAKLVGYNLETRGKDRLMASPRISCIIGFYLYSQIVTCLL
jgi:hypothetical protein